MRKLALFLLLFGVSLALVLLLGRRSRPPAPPVSPERARDPVPELPATPEQATGEGPTIVASGELRFRRFPAAGGRRLYSLHTENLEPRGEGLYDAERVTIESFERESDERQSTLRASRGRLRIQFDDQAEPSIADQGRIDLHDVELELFQGPLAPLTLRSAELEARIESETLRSSADERVDIEGIRLSGEGRGLFYDGAAGRLELARGGRLHFETDAGPVELATPGGGSMVLLGDEATRAFEAHVLGGGRITAAGAEAGQVDAQSLRLFGSWEADGGVTLSRAEAEGGVVATRAEERFTGERASVRFGPEGRIASVELSEDPTWRVVLQGGEAGATTLAGGGAGPLTVDLSGPTRLRLEGAGRLDALERELSIRCEGGMAGELDEASGNARFEARQAVVLEQDPYRLETDELEVHILGGARGDLAATARGASRVEGRTEAGDAFVLTASEHAELERKDGRWSVPMAREVELSVQGEGAFRAEAESVRALDWEQGSGRLEGGVRVETDLGTGEAVSADLRERSRLSLYGIEGLPARFRLSPGATELPEELDAGSFEALSIDVTRERVDARDGVRGEVRAADRTYRLESDTASLVVGAAVGDAGRPFSVTAEGVRRAEAREEGAVARLSAESLRIEGELADAARAPGDEKDSDLAGSTLVAERGVRVEYEGPFSLAGAGERFALSGAGEGRLETEPGRRVSAWGGLPGTALPYEMTAEWISFGSAGLTAPDPHVLVDATMLPVAPRALQSPGFTEARAEWVVAGSEGMLLTGGVQLSGIDALGQGLRVEADSVRVLGDLGGGVEGEALERVIRSIEASGSFEARYGDQALARGDYGYASRTRLELTGEPAVLDVGGVALESRTIEVDLDDFLLTTGRGIVRASEARGGWSLSFASVRPRLQADETLMAVLAPVWVSGAAGARADWAVLWLDTANWRRKGAEVVWGGAADDVLPRPEPEPPPAVQDDLPEKDLVPNVFRRLHERELGQLVHAAYMEGAVEVTQSGLREARADAVLLDIDQGKGWLKNAELVPTLEVGEYAQRVRVRAKEIVTAADGTLRADRATLTACDHEIPHYMVETGSLLLEPREGGNWRISARHNVLRFQWGLQIPLPPIGKAVLDEGGDLMGFENDSGELITFDNVAFGRTARFGTSLGTAFQRDLDFFGRGLGRLFGFDADRASGRWTYEAAWLGSRGPLGGVGLELFERKPDASDEQEFWLNLYVSAIPDSGEDRGLVRVPEEDRDELRSWFRARGRYPFSDTHWIDLAFSKQSDAGVQPEFYEREFLRYEERDTYLHWRKSTGGAYFDARLQARGDDFRSEVEELPTAGAYMGGRPIAEVGPHDLLYELTLDAGRLRRRLGDPGFDIFSEVDAGDGAGEREALRLDTTHRLSLPMDVGGFSNLGLRATPFLDARFTAWDEGIDPEANPMRGGLFGGLELGTTWWKRSPAGWVKSLSPGLRTRNELAFEERDGAPVRFDSIDEAFGGSEVELGLRSRWWKTGDDRRLDLELRAIHAYDRAELEDTTQIAALGDLRARVRTTPVFLLYDGRFDADEEETDYSRLTVGIVPRPGFAVEAGHSRGRSLDGERLFEAASLAARLRASPKWEIEVRQTMSVIDDATLNSEVVVRRFSHDFMLELAVGTRSGEGGTNFSINLHPLLAWRASPLGRFGL